MAGNIENEHSGHSSQDRPESRTNGWLSRSSDIFSASEVSDRVVSSRQAATILSVHESSIKRWCNDGQIPVALTPGGHRRIAFDDLLAFSKSHSIDAPISLFAPLEFEVWSAVQNAVGGQFVEVRALFLEIVHSNRASFAKQLVRLLIDFGVAVDQILDHLIGPVLGKIGQDWSNGTTSIGDEHRMSHIIADCIASVRIHHPFQLQSNMLAVVACAPGEAHELGAQMVRVFLEHNGWEVVFLGQNVPLEDVATQQQKWVADLVCVSVVPPRGPADVASLARGLARMYEPSKPYSLAVGGGNVEATGHDTHGYPFKKFDRFSSFASFQGWLKSLTHSSYDQGRSVAVEKGAAQ